MTIAVDLGRKATKQNKKKRFKFGICLIYDYRNGHSNDIFRLLIGCNNLVICHPSFSKFFLCITLNNILDMFEFGFCPMYGY